ncbi:hypothetical protein E6Q11_05620 [Candidatus Dojkabacteria bacterium]|uniref:Uncharacterized protein n=1 Tax=Candidatus Dojkabacteria bacterium TaxID=2099670 RepID=A0A5C7J3B8_9BACT|nr:MAG: hypothetical protein E6Q11_05620 [Candidatus Dojkabacteria bacterium]
MAILNSELKLVRALTNNDLATNGGRISNNVIVAGSVNGIFPSIDAAERAAGSTKWRKVFWRVDNAASTRAINVRAMLSQPTPGGDHIVMTYGTHIDTQADRNISTDVMYGVGLLSAGVAAGANTIVVATETGTSPAIYRAGDTILLTNKVNLADVAGDMEVAVIDTVNYVGTTATITLENPLVYSYSIGDEVASFDEYAELVSSISGLTVSTVGSGDVDINAISANHIGSLFDTITCTFTSSSTFNGNSALLGPLGAGTVSGGFAPNNPDKGVPYFMIQNTAFSGAFTVGDTFSFVVNPAHVPVWLYRIVPAAIGPLSNNSFRLALMLESE